MRILVVSGSSGGHIFPAISLIESLKAQPNSEVLLVLPKRSRVNIEGIAVKYIDTAIISLRINKENLLNAFNFLKGSLESLILLLGFRPDVVVGFGSIDSVPMLILAWLSRARTLIHEQNIIPGRATRLLAKFSDRIAVSFRQTEDYLKAEREKIVFTGNPLRSQLKRIDRKEALAFFGFQESGFTILVMGGSQSSHKLNVFFSNALADLRTEFKLQIIHICGSQDYSLMQEFYRNFNGKVKLLEFLEEMQYAYSAADLVICRAGATTIAEIIYFAKPAVLIPYPYACQHQSINAEFLLKRGCVVVLEESPSAAQGLKEQVTALIDAPLKLENMRANFSKFTENNAAEALLKEVVSLGKS